MTTFQSVVSSNLSEVGYNPTSQELLVVFKGGSSYLYGGVDQLTYDQLLAAASKGTFLNASIKTRFVARPFKGTPDQAKAYLTGLPAAPGRATQGGTFNNQRDFVRQGRTIFQLFAI